MNEPTQVRANKRSTPPDHGRRTPGQMFGWYDDEWGYTNRTINLVELIAARL
jgi:glyceraldehyde-3-phosphate dehydrogenase/erythrose-4-phosphate dehydrogenase